MYLFSNNDVNEQKFSHHTCRFLTVLNSSLDINDGDRTFTLNKNDILYIPCEHTYQIIAKESAILLYVCFHPYFLLDTIGFSYQQIKYNSLDNPLESFKEFGQLMASFSVAYSNFSDSYRLPVYAKAFDMLHYISSHFIPDYNLPSKMSKKDQKLMQLKQYITQNYKNTITLTDASDALSFTPQYLASFIKKYLGITFHDLLNDYRLKASIILLTYTEEPLSKIAVLCGFSSVSSYTKAFTSLYQLEPLDYRANHPLQPREQLISGYTQITHPSSIRNYILNFTNYVDETTIHHAMTNQAIKRINMSHKKNFSPYWKMLINLGCAMDFEKPAFRKHLVMMQNDLGFQYGRISGCLLLTRSYQLEQDYTYDFSRIFEIIDFLRSIELRPFLDIDNKPFRIYKEDETRTLDYDTFLNTAKYDTFLLKILPLFIKACINRYGFDEFSKWKFELWRRYNPSMTSLEDPATFYNRFFLIAGIFKDMKCEFCLGGPGFNTFLETHYFEQLVDAFATNSYKPDFISAYYFPYSPLIPDQHGSASGYYVDYSPNAMLLKVKEMKEVLDKRGLSHIPFYITEYTPYIISGNYVNDSTYPATYILRQVIDNYKKVDALGYWLASDISLDYNLSSSPFFGGNGILSRNGIKKPSYYAFELLNKLGTFLVSRGEHYIITATDEFRFQILVYYNNDVHNEMAKDPMNETLLLYPYYGFVQTNPLEIQLHLTNLHPGEYSMKETTLDLTHGNVLSIWGQLNHIKDVRPSDVEYMKHQSTPYVHQYLEKISDTYLLHTSLGSNEVKLFSFERYQ